MVWSLFKKLIAPTSGLGEHAVIVRTGSRRITQATVDKIEDRCTEILAGKGVGELDGHDIAIDESDANFYFYGPDADALFATVLPVLQAFDETARGVATLRYGEARDPNAQEVRVRISEATQ